MLNKPSEDRDTVEKIFELLSRPFGTGVTLNHARAAFISRKQRPQECVSAFLDNLEGLRVRAFPREPKDERNLEILLKFRDGVSNPGLHNMLLIKYSDEESAMKPPTVEQLRHVANEFLRHQDANRNADYRNNQPKYNAEVRKPSLSVTAPQQIVAPATGEGQPRQEIRPAESKPAMAGDSKRPPYPNVRKPIEEIVCYFC